MSGYFIALEGIDGCGKSTQAKRLAELLTHSGRSVVLTREPGSTPAGEVIRQLLFNTDLLPISEVYLFAADRAEHIERVIKPALKRNKVVISDRYLLSSVVYQGIGKGVGTDIVRKINAHVTDGISPDITFVLDLPVDKSIKRVQNANRFEYRELQVNVKKGFLAEASSNPKSITVIDANGSVDEVTQSIWRRLTFGGSK